jgi:hypothetical protein
MSNTTYATKVQAKVHPNAHSNTKMIGHDNVIFIKPKNQANVDFITTIKFIGTPKMRLIIPFIIFKGVSLATEAGVLLNFWVSTVNSNLEWSQETEDQKIERMIYTFISLGIGSIFGSTLLGIIQDKFGHTASITLMITTLLCTISGFLI